jgi:hypothetical protein
MAEISLREFDESGAMKRDPYWMALKLLIAVVRLQPEVVRAISVAKHPLADMKADLLVALREGAVQGASGEARYLGRKLDRRMAVWIGISVGAAYVAGVVTVAAFSYLTDTGQFGPTDTANPVNGDLIFPRSGGVIFPTWQRINRVRIRVAVRHRRGRIGRVRR